MADDGDDSMEGAAAELLPGEVEESPAVDVATGCRGAAAGKHSVEEERSGAAAGGEDRRGGSLGAAGGTREGDAGDARVPSWRKSRARLEEDPLMEMNGNTSSSKTTCRETTARRVTGS